MTVLEESTTILTNPAPQSSVQIEQAAKGPPRVTVKTYSADPFEACRIAQEIYDQMTARYREETAAAAV